TASLMYYHHIPISNVVPHYHWPRPRANPPNKDCPHFLLEDGKPGATWKWFLSRVERHYHRIQAPSRNQPALAAQPSPGIPAAPASGGVMPIALTGETGSRRGLLAN
ncbi:MAG: hypothetical protein KDM64_15935, partial [Verrucomicrobiae bacterium]|nr:hypothetical protein [Verrucomicrobiae bacterium]